MAEAVVPAEKAQELELCEGPLGFSGQVQHHHHHHQQQQQYPSEVVYQYYSGNDMAYQYDPRAQAQLPTLLDPTQGLVVMTDHRRKSVASVQTGQSSTTTPRHPVKRRRSETIDKGRPRRSRPDDDFSLTTSDGHSRRDDLRRGNSSASEGRRANRNSQLIGIEDLESARMMMSGSSGHYYKTDHHMNGNPDTQDQDEPHRSRVVVVCASIAVGIFLTAILLVAITLRMSPAIDEMVRKENEDILRELQGVSASTLGLNTTVQPSDTTENPQT